MSQPFPPPPPPPIATAPAASSNRATTALILGIVGVVCCGLAAPFAWVMGNKELEAIRAGLAPAANQGLATAGKILGIIGTILLGLGIIWMIFFGGLTLLGAMADAGN